MDVAWPGSGRMLLPVASNPVAEALRLAHVHDVAPGVAHEVDAGSVGQLLEGRLEVGGHASDRTGNDADGPRRPARRSPNGRSAYSSVASGRMSVGGTRKGAVVWTELDSSTS